jgi:KipI family sensor histidine kinase inhibitor
MAVTSSAPPLAAPAAFPRLAPLGDAAVTVTLGAHVSLALNRRVHRLAAAVRTAADAGTLPAVVDVVPAYAALTVFYEPLRTGLADLLAALEPLVAAHVRADHGDHEDHDEPGDEPGDAPRPPGAREHVIPVRYDGPDLVDVARRLGLAPADVVARHAARRYDVYLLGFVPGFAYLGDLDPTLELPRRADPRPRVPSGSVAIAGRQTAVYPLPTPGGWHLVGHTDVRLLDPDRTPPALLAPGDRVRFVPA